MKFDFGFRWPVVVGLILLSLVLGVLNNLRVYEEQRVEWFGGPAVESEEV